MMIATDPSDNVSLVDTGIRTNPTGDRFVTASLRFVGSQFHVQVDIDFLDKNGDVVGSTVAEESHINAGETWFIEAPVSAENAVRFQLHNLICSPTPQSSEWQKKRACALTYEGIIQ